MRTLQTGDAWNRFLSNLKRKDENLPEAGAIPSSSEAPEPHVSPIGKQKVTGKTGVAGQALVAIIILIVGACHISHLETLL